MARSSGGTATKTDSARSGKKESTPAATPATETTGQVKDQENLIKKLLEGFEVKSRPNGTVHTIKAGKATVGEVVVGKTKVRMNLRSIPDGKAPKAIKLDGSSESWKGGGVVVTDGNLPAARELMKYVVNKALKSQPKDATAQDAAADQAAREAEASDASKRLQEAGEKEPAQA